MDLSRQQVEAISEATAAAVAFALSNARSGAENRPSANHAGTDHHDVHAELLVGAKLPAGVAHVSGETIRKILRVEFVELATLLPSRSAHAEPEAKRFKINQTDGNEIVLASAASSKRKIESLIDWVEAWSIFSTIVTCNMPDTANGLMQHQLRVVQAAQKYRLAAVLEFDIRVRQAIAKDSSRSIGVMDTELFTQCFTGHALPVCNKCHKTGHVTSSCFAGRRDTASFRGSQPAKGGQDQPVCRRFNTGSCSFTECKYEHVCSFCRGSHAAASCPARQTA